MRSVSLRERLVLLALVGILPLATMSGIGLQMLVKQQRVRAEQSGLELTRALATAVDAGLGESVSVLETLAASVQSDAATAKQFYVLAKRVTSSQSDWILIHLADPSGVELLNTDYPMGRPAVSIPERESFDEVVNSLKPKVGYLSRGPRGLWGVPVRVPVVRNGRLHFVLTGVMKPDAILAVVSRQNVPQEWIVSVFDAKGARVARSRSNDKYIGGPASASLQKLIARGGDEGRGMTASLEGEPIYTAYTRSPTSGWIVAIGIPSRAMEAGVYQSLAVYGGGIFLSFIFAVVAAVGIRRRIKRPIRGLAPAARAMDAGKPFEVPASGIREIDDLANALIASDAAASAARRQAETASRTKDEVLAMLGHELRNPLAPIVTALRLMEMRPDERNTKERQIIEPQAAHLSRLVDDLLDISRITRGKIELHLERTNLATVVARALEMTQPAIERRVRPIEVELPPEPVFVVGDAMRLTQVLCNLVTNAVRHTSNDGRIVLRVREANRMVEISLEDFGSGIAPDLLPRVFELFAQGQQSIDRRAGGLGLRLAIVKGPAGI